jgi:hypothetical protein
MKRIVLALAFALAACGGGNHPRATPVPSAASAWEIGPIIGDRNYSVGMPLHPRPDLSFDIPYPTAAAGHVHYLTFVHGPLKPTDCLGLRYRLDMAEGVQLVPAKEQPGVPSMLSLYFQRRGDDDMSGQGKAEAWRWYSPRLDSPITAGEHELKVCLSENWTAVQTSSALTNPSGYLDAILNAERVGFVLGGGDGRGHGVYSTGPARFTILGFEVTTEAPPLPVSQGERG